MCAHVWLCCVHETPQTHDPAVVAVDTGMGPRLEAILAAHPDISISVNAETAQWEAVERPSPSCVVISHAPTLNELIVKLDGGTP